MLPVNVESATLGISGSKGKRRNCEEKPISGLICTPDLSLVYAVFRTESIFTAKSTCPKKKDIVNQIRNNQGKKRNFHQLKEIKWEKS